MSPTFSDKVELKLIELAIEIEITYDYVDNENSWRENCHSKLKIVCHHQINYL